jgi:hypothetical protein
MNFFKHIRSGEKGQVLIGAIIILAVGSLIITPLLSFMSTNIKSTLGYQNKMKESYACDAGIEDAVHKMIKDVPSLETLTEDGSWTYTLTSNGLPVTVTITAACLLDGFLGSDEYKTGQPHEGWVQYEIPVASVIRNYDENWVEYYCKLDFEYTGAGNRVIESIGVFYSPFPGDIVLIEDPYDIVYTPVITAYKLDGIETKVANGGFAFIWRWQQAFGPKFNVNDKTGSIYFKFRVNDAAWAYKSTFMWTTFKEQDVSYLTNAELNKWLIQASAGQTTTKVQALEDEGTGRVVYLTWERN